MPTLPPSFPFRPLLSSFLDEYAACPTYWYVPHTRVLTETNVADMREFVRVVFDGFLGREWTAKTQDELLSRLVDRGVLQPYQASATLQDRTALIRIWKKWLEMLGLVWIQDDQELLVTDAGLTLLEADAPSPTIERQVSKLQYPAPWLETDYSEQFRGLLPQIFLLQVMQGTDWHLSVDEFELFVNLAREHSDAPRIVSYITHWRNLSAQQRERLLSVARTIPMARLPQPQATRAGTSPTAVRATRYVRIRNTSTYARSVYTFSSLLNAGEGPGISVGDTDRATSVLKQQLDDLKVPEFPTLDDWFVYMGDPEQEASWLTYLRQLTVTTPAPAKEKVEALIDEAGGRLTPDQRQEIRQRRLERLIEEYYAEALSHLEAGLELEPDGRQYTTPIGRIDLLCRSRAGDYVVVEVKVGDAEDAVFGQILRYIGWVHGNLGGGATPVRGIILAGGFPEKARYSRTGLLKPDADRFLKFREHGLKLAAA